MIQARLDYSFSTKHKKIALRTLFNGVKPNMSHLNNIFTTENIYFTNYARTGLQLILSTLAPRSRVGVQPFTCLTVLQAIENANCEIVFLDINKQLILDTVYLAKHVHEIDALIVTHTFGFAANVTEISSICKDKIIIEDCAHAFLSKHNHQLVGKKGDYAIFSHGNGKFPSALGGGFVLVNNKSLIRNFELAYTKIASPTFSNLVLQILHSFVLHIAHNKLIFSLLTYRLKNRKNIEKKHLLKHVKKMNLKSGYRTNMAVLASLLTNIDEELIVQQINGKKIFAAIQHNTEFEICQKSDGMNYFMIPLLVKSPEHFIRFARNRGIEIGRHFVQSWAIVDNYGYKKGSCPTYETVLKNIVTIPSHCHYPASGISNIVSILKTYSNA